MQGEKNQSYKHTKNVLILQLKARGTKRENLREK